MGWVQLVFIFLRSLVRTRTELATENLALRQQLAILRERKRILRSYFEYYQHSRTHLSLDRNSPVQREVEPPHLGKLIAIPQVGGLHYRYRRAA